MEALNSYSKAVSTIGEGEQEEFLDHVAAKALIGDSDFMHNFGRLEGGYALIDPDQAGAPIQTFENKIFDYLEVVNSGTSFNVSHQDFQDALGRVFREAGEQHLEDSLSKLEAFKDDIPAYANFEPVFVRENFRSAPNSGEVTGAERPRV
ncbi:MAG: hypothetical protein ABEJ87_02670 [Candidatus Nanohalobium sp.]